MFRRTAGEVDFLRGPPTAGRKEIDQRPSSLAAGFTQSRIQSLNSPWFPTLVHETIQLFSLVFSKTCGAVPGHKVKPSPPLNAARRSAAATTATLSPSRSSPAMFEEQKPCDDRRREANGADDAVDDAGDSGERDASAGQGGEDAEPRPPKRAVPRVVDEDGHGRAPKRPRVTPDGAAREPEAELDPRVKSPRAETASESANVQATIPEATTSSESLTPAGEGLVANSVASSSSPKQGKMAAPAQVTQQPSPATLQAAIPPQLLLKIRNYVHGLSWNDLQREAKRSRIMGLGMTLRKGQVRDLLEQYLQCELLENLRRVPQPEPTGVNQLLAPGDEAREAPLLTAAWASEAENVLEWWLFNAERFATMTGEAERHAAVTLMEKLQQGRAFSPEDVRYFQHLKARQAQLLTFTAANPLEHMARPLDFPGESIASLRPEARGAAGLSDWNDLGYGLEHERRFHRVADRARSSFRDYARYPLPGQFVGSDPFGRGSRPSRASLEQEAWVARRSYDRSSLARWQDAPRSLPFGGQGYFSVPRPWR
eukprot:scaffold3815_cov251-Pinguiococcus_pyrenoidosus.AAC.2